MSLVHPTRHHARSHLHSASAASPGHSHSTVKHTPATAARSRWSDSDTESLAASSPSSSAMSPMPITPFMDAVVSAPAVNKHSPEDVAASQNPSHHQIVSVPLPIATKVPIVPSQSTRDYPSHQQSHHRLSSALQLLKSFPIPHFHHSNSSSHSSSEPSPLSSASTSSSAASFQSCRQQAQIQSHQAFCPAIASI